MVKINSKIKAIAKKTLPIFKAYPQIKLVYLFGSRAKEKAGPLSDYDFAFFLDEPDSCKRFDLKLKLFNRLSLKLKTNKIDVVILNDLESPELKYAVIKEGKLIYEKGAYKVLVEPKILNEYFDFRLILLRYNLTKAKNGF